MNFKSPQQRKAVMLSELKKNQTSGTSQLKPISFHPQPLPKIPAPTLQQPQSFSPQQTMKFPRLKKMFGIKF